MAIEVTSWSEFLEAASGDDPTVEINCPENAEWDIGEIEPEGHIGRINICGVVNGRGTKIKNLVIDSNGGAYVLYMRGTIYDLHFIDNVWKCLSGVILIDYSNTSVQLCTFSASIQTTTRQIGLFGQSNIGRNDTALVYRCACNLEASLATGITVFGGNIVGQYNNMKFSGSGVTALTLNTINGTLEKGKSEYSYIILDMPAITSLSMSKFNSSLLRCTGSNVTDLRYVGGDYVSVACSSDFPNASQVAQTLALCTESQLHDAVYLQSIGFPIGV